MPKKLSITVRGMRPQDFAEFAESFEPSNATAPCWALPGTAVRINSIARRIRRGQTAFHPDDVLTRSDRAEKIAALVGCCVLF